MKLATRIYYMPKNRISIHLINYMVSKIGCSIGELRVNQKADTIQVPITCNERDIKKVEQILIRYDMLEV